MADQVPNTPMGIPDVGSTDDERLKGAIAYILTWLTGIIVLIIAGDNKFLKFHALQSIVFGIVISIIVFILTFVCIGPIVGFVCWLYMLYGAYLVYSGKPFRIPVIADFVEKNLLK
jgi:uncharacterized membrane protein